MLQLFCDFIQFVGGGDSVSSSVLSLSALALEMHGKAWYDDVPLAPFQPWYVRVEAVGFFAGKN